MAMILCHEANLDKRYGADMLLQVHDELVFECPEETALEAKKEIKEWMEHPFPDDLAVALDVSISIGANWAEAK
jgi:DNA polymerase-1